MIASRRSWRPRSSGTSAATPGRSASASASPERDSPFQRAPPERSIPERFDVEKFPTLTFKSTKIAKVGDEEIAITGDLSLHGVTKSVTLAVKLGGQAKDPWAGIRTGFSAKTTINRKDFGLGWNTVLETGGVLVGEKIEITLEIEAVQAGDARFTARSPHE